jgi:hypothetical protein
MVASREEREAEAMAEVNQDNFRNCRFTDVKLRADLFHHPNKPIAVDLSGGVVGLDDHNVVVHTRRAVQGGGKDCQGEGGDRAQGQLARRIHQALPGRWARGQGGRASVQLGKVLAHAYDTYI